MSTSPRLREGTTDRWRLTHYVRGAGAEAAEAAEQVTSSEAP